MTSILKMFYMLSFYGFALNIIDTWSGCLLSIMNKNISFYSYLFSSLIGSIFIVCWSGHRILIYYVGSWTFQNSFLKNNFIFFSDSIKCGLYLFGGGKSFLYINSKSFCF